MAIIKTIHFFKMLLSNKSPQSIIETTNLQITENLSLKTDIYLPRKKYAGTILFFHGMNKYGKDDERVKKLCASFAVIGYRVIVPNYALIMNHIWDPISVDEFEETILSLCANNALCPTGKLAIFTASLSGTLALFACGRPATQNKVTSFLTIGSGFQVKDIFVVGLSNPHYDRYTKLICAKALMHHAKVYNQNLMKGISIAIDDAFRKDNENRFNKYLPLLSTKDQQELKSIVEDDNLDWLYNKHKEVLSKQEQKLFNSGDYKLLTMPVILIHSLSDVVFPPIESRRTAEKLEKAGANCRLVITSLLDHVDHNISWHNITEAFNLFCAFYYFFKNI